MSFILCQHLFVYDVLFFFWMITVIVFAEIVLIMPQFETPFIPLSRLEQNLLILNFWMILHKMTRFDVRCAEGSCHFKWKLLWFMASPCRCNFQPLQVKSTWNAAWRYRNQKKVFGHIGTRMGILKNRWISQKTTFWGNLIPYSDLTGQNTYLCEILGSHHV